MDVYVRSDINIHPDVVGEFGERWNLASHYPV